MNLREAEVVYRTRRIEGAAKIYSAADVYRVCRDLGDKAQEHFAVLYLNVRHAVMGRQIVSIGTVNSVEVHPREVFRGAIMAGATAIIVVHNHPSGECDASAEDHALTRRLAQCGQHLGVPVLDHVVIGDGSYQSIAESRPDLLASP